MKKFDDESVREYLRKTDQLGSAICDGKANARDAVEWLERVGSGGNPVQEKAVERLREFVDANTSPTPTPKDESMRGTGRSTALMLRAISDALLNPDQVVLFLDHEPMTFIRAADFQKSIRAIVKQMRLTIDVGTERKSGGPFTLTLVSPMKRIREEFAKRYERATTESQRKTRKKNDH